MGEYFEMSRRAHRRASPVTAARSPSFWDRAKILAAGPTGMFGRRCSSGVWWPGRFAIRTM
jgi:hypothetical protein